MTVDQHTYDRYPVVDHTLFNPHTHILSSKFYTEKDDHHDDCIYLKFQSNWKLWNLFGINRDAEDIREAQMSLKIDSIYDSVWNNKEFPIIDTLFKHLIVFSSAI